MSHIFKTPRELPKTSTPEAFKKEVELYLRMLRDDAINVYGLFVYALDQETDIANPNTWYVTSGNKVIPVIEGFSPARINTPGVRYDGQRTQLFKIDWAVSYIFSTVRSVIHLSVFKNGVMIPGSDMETFGATVDGVYNLSGHAVVELSLGDEINLQASSDKAGVLDIHHETTTVNPLFN
jgi:hypothetical protein